MLSRRLVRIVAIFVAVTPSAFAAPMTLRVDATEAPRKIYHAELNIPATPGPMTLFYPKWIPGDHAPTGPINDLAGLRISAAGQPLVWKRDSVELFAFHIDVPPGANSVDVRLDFLSPAKNGTNSPVSATSELAILTWNQLVLYPRGQASDDLEITAQLRLPEGWKFGTALPVAKTNGSSVEFKTVSLTTLVDSPVLAGRHFRRIDLSPGVAAAHYLDIAADTDDALSAPAEVIDKYRRPEGLATHDFEEPMKGDLLWVYEGLTEYLGWVLAARSGLISPESNRQFLALSAAGLDNRAGRQWRPLADTAIAAQLLYDARSDWESRRRGVDFYDEGLLMWLEADVSIRKQTQGRKSLDDFCRLFYGPPSGPPQVKPYAFEDLIETLNSIALYDWKGFFETRLNRTGTDRAPLGGVEAGGYRLAYVEQPSEAQRATEQIRPSLSVAYSIGLRLDRDGSIVDVLPEFAAAKAGIGPGMKIVSVNDNRYSRDVLREAIRNTKNGGPLELRVANGRSFVTFKLDYHDGEKYPVLQRNGQAPLLDDIMKPVTR